MTIDPNTRFVKFCIVMIMIMIIIIIMIIQTFVGVQTKSETFKTKTVKLLILETVTGSIECRTKSAVSCSFIDLPNSNKTKILETHENRGGKGSEASIFLLMFLTCSTSGLQ